MSASGEVEKKLDMSLEQIINNNPRRRTRRGGDNTSAPSSASQFSRRRGQENRRRAVNQRRGLQIISQSTTGRTFTQQRIQRPRVRGTTRTVRRIPRAIATTTTQPQQILIQNPFTPNAQPTLYTLSPNQPSATSTIVTSNIRGRAVRRTRGTTTRRSTGSGRVTASQLIPQNQQMVLVPASALGVSTTAVRSLGQMGVPEQQTAPSRRRGPRSIGQQPIVVMLPQQPATTSKPRRGGRGRGRPRRVAQ